jgi:membrane fusion protein, copper/silver efflux system
MVATLRRTSMKVASGMVVLLVLFVLAQAGERTSTTPARQPTTAGPVDPHAGGHGAAGHGRPSPSSPGEQEHTAGPTPQQENVIALSPERLQAIGVKFELAKYRPVERSIRTVGQVEVDERRLAHVNIKLEGWIDQLFVNSTGGARQEGQDSLHALQP